MIEQLTSGVEINHDDSGHHTGIQFPDSLDLLTIVMRPRFNSNYVRTRYSIPKSLEATLGSRVGYTHGCDCREAERDPKRPPSSHNADQR